MKNIPFLMTTSENRKDKITDAMLVGIKDYIIKPVDANSSKGVQVLDSLDDFQKAYESAFAHSPSETVLLEEFMEGEEYCVDGLVYQEQYILGGITGKERAPLPHRFDTGIHMPPRLSSAEHKAIDDCAFEALQAIGFANGTFHLEIIVTFS